MLLNSKFFTFNKKGNRAKKSRKSGSLPIKVDGKVVLFA